MKDTLENVFGSGIKAQCRRIAGKEGAKVIAKHISKAAGRTLARTAASPWLLTADAAEFVTERITSKAGCDQKTVKAAGKGVGFATSIGVGFAVGGPVGILAGATLWGIGEAIGRLFD